MKKNQSTVFPESEGIKYKFGDKVYIQEELSLGQEVRLLTSLKGVLGHLPPSIFKLKDTKEIGMQIIYSALDYSEEFIYDALSIIFNAPREEFAKNVHLADFLNVVDGFFELNDIERLTKYFLVLMKRIEPMMNTKVKIQKNNLQQS